MLKLNIDAMGKQVINILWTGGWDSTYRVIDLSFKEVVIQPYYLRDNRLSEAMELSVIRNLTEKIRNRKTNKSELLEVIIVEIEDRKVNFEYSSSYNVLDEYWKNRSGGKSIGSQYEWLSIFSIDILNLELGIEKGCKVITTIKEFGDLELVENSEKGSYYQLNKEVSTLDLINIFGAYHFPLLDLSKQDMRNHAKKLGFLDLMNETWFCHSPRENKACGECNPCKQTIEAGLTYRFDKKALDAYKRVKYNIPVKKSYLSRMAKKIKSLYR